MDEAQKRGYFALSKLVYFKFQLLELIESAMKVPILLKLSIFTTTFFCIRIRMDHIEANSPNFRSLHPFLKKGSFNQAMTMLTNTKINTVPEK